ncbi:Ribosomal protein l2 [Thalictrum thalictroides]|uniref:Ribosomal protein l2 n=1 Tax=Thalictrum thalictroides TaxID=46969 RepID=A0A7J6VKK0_THATH|nr:Ribosomal protein l2 [Thalictrum thalictroides]
MRVRITYLARRNSQGRIPSFHRGGGVKRLQRTIDLKRTTPSLGIIERIEYDPNRSSRLALVRWIEGVRQPRKCNVTEEFVSPREFRAYHGDSPRRVFVLFLAWEGVSNKGSTITG